MAGGRGATGARQESGFRHRRWRMPRGDTLAQKARASERRGRAGRGIHSDRHYGGADRGGTTLTNRYVTSREICVACMWLERCVFCVSVARS